MSNAHLHAIFRLQVYAIQSALLGDWKRFRGTLASHTETFLFQAIHATMSGKSEHSWQDDASDRSC